LWGNCRWGGGGTGSATGGAQNRTPWLLQIEEERCRSAPGVQLTLTLLDGFLGLFAVLTADGERQRPQALLGDFVAALEAIAVGALLQAGQRIVDFAERFRLHLNERALDVFLNIGFGAFDGVEDLGQLG